MQDGRCYRYSAHKDGVKFKSHHDNLIIYEMERYSAPRVKLILLFVWKMSG